ncbi:uncharacterized protein LOC110110158 [Dendrobium catenatum]|uniref:CREG-like beta-barrel domain-containing protein n=1 Tax=Dendrobium catenatum TaxID=906689 RepID=A0A2I0W9G1_9ASPA|nr:uncharacterized protein LOC110110158 [Dendrobium catenatum]PKU72281.1 hypothetical protein MA16_Dca006281 [Dendrobium catenatum]
MEALVSSSFTSWRAEPYSSRHSCVFSCPKVPSFGQCLFKTHQNSKFPSLFSRRSGVRAVTNEVFDGGKGEEQPFGNGSALHGVELKHNKDEGGMDKVDVIEKEVTRPYGANFHGGSTTRAGLFRTPISGGLHSATFSHDLPPAALAVRNLMEQARFAHLCTVMSRMHHRRAGYPCGSLVDYATDSMGHPIFSLSPLAIHTRNLLADSRCTLVVQIPGWSGLSNARATIFGDAIPLPADKQDWACNQFISKHQQWASQQWGNFYYYRMATIRDIYFIGGFGTVQWIDVKDYEDIQPDKIAADGGEQNLKELNAIFSKPLKEILSTEGEIDDVAFISIDSKGTDVRVRQGAQFNIQRLSFEEENGVQTLEDAKKALQRIVSRGSNSREIYRS